MATVLDVAALYAECRPAVYAFVRRRIPPPFDMAEDITADVFERAVKSAHTWQDCGLSPKVWLFRIARNLLIDHARQRQCRPVSAELTTTNIAAPSHDIAHLIDRLEVEPLLDALVPSQREAIVHRFYLDQSILDTARVLDTSPEAVKKLQYRAIRNLRRIHQKGTAA